MTEKFSNQGTLVAVSGTIIHTAPDNNISEVQSMRFTNTAAFVLTVQKYNAATAATTTIYTLNLSAGDIVTDTFNYNLSENDYIKAISNVAGTTFMINGDNLPNINVVRCK
jgi:hypothetical protein